MGFQKTISSIILAAYLLPFTVLAQSKWTENDDMYFSKKDRQKIYASINTVEQSEFAAINTSPTVLTTADPDAANNQYFIKDYSIKNKADNEVKTYSGINSNTGFQSGVNVILSFGSSFGSPYYGSYYNPYTDPFSPYYDPFYRYGSSRYYSSYRYNPWQYNSVYGYNGGYNNGYNSGYNSGYYGNNVCVSTSYSSNVRNEVRYRNGRKIVTGSRNARANSRPSFTNSDKVIKNTSSAVNSNGRSTSRTSRSSYRKYPNSAQNRIADEAASQPKRVNTYNRTNGNSTNKNWNNSSNYNRSTNYRNTGSSSGSRSSSYSRPSSGGSRSSGSSARPSTGGSRSRGGRGNN